MKFENDLTNLIILSLATFRLSLLFAVEDGLFNMFERIRVLVGVKRDENGIAYGTNMLSQGLVCMWCNSLWFAIILTGILFLLPSAARQYFYICMLPLALSAMAVIVKGDKY